MKIMVLDGITAAILRPVLAREGRTLADLAASLADAARGGYERRSNRSGRPYEWWGFATTGGMTDDPVATLCAPGDDDFSSPSDRTPLARLPDMSGGIKRVGAAHQLAIGAIRLGDMTASSRMVMVTPHRPLLALIGVDVPLTVQQATGDRPLKDVVSSPDLDHAALRLVRWRTIGADRLAEVDLGSQVDAIAAKLKTLPAVTVQFAW